MAITATFAADFSSFLTAVDKADTKLRAFETGAARVDSLLSKFGNQFSGTKLIQDAIAMEKAIADIGGASKLTTQELIRAGDMAAQAGDKMRKLGMDVPKGLTDIAAAGAKAKDSLAGVRDATSASSEQMFSLSGIVTKLGPQIVAAFSVGAVVSFAQEIGSFAGKMVDLSDQTGIATEDLQALNYVAAGAGLTIEDITGAVTQLSNRLAGGDKSAAAAMAQLGLNTEALLSQSPDQAMLAIAGAVSQIPTPMERTAVSMDLFGKSGGKMLRIMNDELGTLIDQAKESGAVIDDELVRRADKFDDAWTQAILKVKGMLASLVLGPSTDDLREQLREVTARRAGMKDARSQATLDSAISELNFKIDMADFEKQRKALGGGPANPFVPAGIGPAQSTEAAMRLAGITEPTTKAGKEAAEKLRTAAEAQERAARALESWARNAQGESQRNADAKLWQDQADAQQSAIDAGTLQIEGLLPSYSKGKAGAQYGPAAIESQGVSQEADRAATKAGESFTATLAGHVGPSIIKAVQGGGSVIASIGSTVGSDVANKLLGPDSSIGKALTGKEGVVGNVLKSVAGMIPMIGPMLGPAIEGATKLIGKIMGSEGKKTNKERDAWIGENFGDSDNLRKMAKEAGIADGEMAKLFSTKKVKDFEAAAESVTKKLNAFNDEQAADAERLTAAYQKYGFTFDEIGAKAQQMQLDASAKELIEDWRVLVSSGISVDNVNTKMAESVNEYLQAAIKTGSEVPAAMRPMLEKLLEQGLLTDEAGTAITDLTTAGVTFAETMTAGFDRVVQKLDEMIKKLIDAGNAVSDLPSVPSGPSTPGEGPPLFEPADLPGYATGTGGKYLNFGAGTPVMLHGRERIMREGEGDGGGATLAAIHSLQVTMVRAIRENALGVRDQTLIALGRA